MPRAPQTFFFIAVLTLHPKDYDPKRYLCPTAEDPAARCYPEEEEWPHFFKMPVLMLMLITLLNDGTLISIGYDSVKPSSMPEKWNLRVSGRDCCAACP